MILPCLVGNHQAAPHRHGGRRDGGSNSQLCFLQGYCSHPSRRAAVPTAIQSLRMVRLFFCPPQSGRGRFGHVWLVGQGSQAGRRGRREGPPWLCPPLPRQVCSGGPYGQTDSSGHMPNPSHPLLPLVSMGRGVTGPGIDVVVVVVVVSTHPREEDQENERKKKDGTCRRPKEPPK